LFSFFLCLFQEYFSQKMLGTNFHAEGQPLRILREQQQRAGNNRERTFARHVHV
jgi:hypothetical protein